MDIIYYFNLFKRWAWLLALGLFFGLIGGYLVSYFQEPVYEATTKLMITRQIQNENPDFAGLNSQQLVQTYVEILKTKPLLDTASERVGIEIDPEDITVQQILDTQIIEIKVEDYNPEKAADLANTMVLVLIEQKLVALRRLGGLADLRLQPFDQFLLVDLHVVFALIQRLALPF